MLGWSATFAVITVLAAIMGFTPLFGELVRPAQFFFWVSLLLSLYFLLCAVIPRVTPPETRPDARRTRAPRRG